MSPTCASQTKQHTDANCVPTLTDIPHRQEICDNSVNTDAEHCDSVVPKFASKD